MKGGRAGGPPGARAGVRGSGTAGVARQCAAGAAAFPLTVGSFPNSDVPNAGIGEGG